MISSMRVSLKLIHLFTNNFAKTTDEQNHEQITLLSLLLWWAITSTGPIDCDYDYDESKTDWHFVLNVFFQMGCLLTVFTFFSLSDCLSPCNHGNPLLGRPTHSPSPIAPWNLHGPWACCHGNKQYTSHMVPPLNTINMQLDLSFFRLTSGVNEGEKVVSEIWVKERCNVGKNLYLLFWNGTMHVRVQSDKCKVYL